MVIYEFARIEGFSDRSYGGVVCTNTNELESLVNELQKIEPLLYDPQYHKNYKLKIQRKNGSSPFHIDIEDVGNDDIARWWLVNWFCEHGWEPFSHFEGSYSFRRVREQD